MSMFFCFSPEGRTGEKEYPVKFNRIFSFFCMAVFWLCLVSCAANPSVSDISLTSSEGSKNSLTSYPFTMMDSYGNTAEIIEEPQRIVSCAPNITELLFDLGVGQRVVGRTDYCNYPDEVFLIESVGSIDMPSIEKIVELEPDLVIASSIFAKDSYDQLIGLGIPVVVFHEEYDVDGVLQMIRSVGQIVNQSATADTLIGQMEAELTRVFDAVEGLSKPTVYYAVSYGEYGDYTAGGDTFVHKLITRAGGLNIAEDVSGWSYSLEKLVEQDPDIILVNQYMLEDFLATPPYDELTAVKNGRVYGINSDLIERQGFRNAEGIAVLAEIFYPDVFS